MLSVRQADAGEPPLHYGVTFPVSVQDCSPIRSELLIPLRGSVRQRACLRILGGRSSAEAEARREILSGIHAGINVAAGSSYAVTESDDGLQGGS